MKIKYIIFVVVGIVVIFIGFGLYNQDPFRLRGNVYGDNPNNISKSDLPYCNFNGQDFVEEPCYSPPDAIYE